MHRLTGIAAAAVLAACAMNGEPPLLQAPQRYMVKPVDADTPPEALLQRAARHCDATVIQLRSMSGGAYVWEAQAATATPDALLRCLRDSGEFEYVEPDRQMRSAD
jgi:hypothetical protein